MSPDMPPNLLYYGDNLDILRRYIKDETVDLIYLDPPFNSAQDYNVLFEERNGTEASAQIHAFKDTWRWDATASAEYERTIRHGGKVAEALASLRLLLGCNDMLAYLAMMAPRLAELHRVLKPAGSLYLHCDPTASPYLRILLDAIFGARQFQNEIIWKRTSARSDSHRWNHVHDVIFFYTKSDHWTWNPVYTPYDSDYLKKFYRFEEEETGRRYTSSDLTAAGIRKGESGKIWRSVNPTSKKRHWALPNKAMEELGIAEGTMQDKLDQLEVAGRIIWPAKKGGVPRFKRYLDEMPGMAPQSVITDIPPISAQAKERLGYATQKPQALLERIIEASSKKKQIVLDPFCGCGTTVAAAQKLGRRWIGIDVTHLAIALIRKRLNDTFGKRAHYRVIGEPVSITDAEALAIADPFQFQCWALGLAGARPSEPVKKGADKGIDGKLFFFDDATNKAKTILFSVKSGKSGPAHVRDLIGTVDTNGAQMGVLLLMHEATPAMRAAAATAGQYHSPGFHKDYPRLQILTVQELLTSAQVQMPPSNVTFKRAAQDQTPDAAASDLFGLSEDAINGKDQETEDY
ncbi:MAG: DNA methyltransferase [Candidatus Sumerlaeota bacterium]|nr:DNA methyltransferase [Candidatus Sumerlaeota bacterium]